MTHVDSDGTQWIETVSLGGPTMRQTEGRDPAWLPDGRLLYTCLHPGWENPASCVMDFEGGRFDLLAESEHPVPAPDGGTIAVHRGMIDVGETWLMSADGVLPHLLAKGSFLQWSPDGVWLLGQPESATAQVAVVRADGSDAEPQVLATGYDPAWSPKGDQIAYVVVDDQGVKLRVMTPFSDVSETEFTAPQGSELAAPEWLPDGGLLFVLDGDLYRLDGDPVSLCG